MTDDLNIPSVRPLENRPCAIVIGASSGSGAAFARLLAREGYLVALLARREAALERLSKQINEEYGETRAIPVVHDVQELTVIPTLFQTLLRDLGRLDMIVYAAGVMPNVALDEFDLEKDQTTLAVNLNGAVAWLDQAATLFSRMGAGQIVAFSSVAGDRGRVKNPAYNAAKAGLDAYLEGLRNRLTRKGVRILTVKPGFVDTAMLAGSSLTFWVVTPDHVAEHIWRAVRRRRQLVYIPGRWRWLMLVIRNIPSAVFRRLSF